MRMCEREMSMKQSRSASICVGESGTPPRRRRPAARSQSARIPPAQAAARRKRMEPASSDTKLDSTAFCESSERGLERGLSRKGSRRVTATTNRKSTAFLDVPDPPSPPSEDNLVVRSFSFNSKGIVNRGDSFRKRRSRSNSLAGSPPREVLSPLASPDGGCPSVYRVLMVGVQGVGKTALVSQFQTSECINAYDRPRDDTCEQTVHVMLNGEESELQFVTDSEVEKGLADGYMVMFSVIDKASFQRAEDLLARLHHSPITRNKATILVANKIDLVRSRAVSTQDGKCLACMYGAKFIEISVGINHNVDELLVGMLTQMRLKEASAGLVGHKDPSRHWYNSHGVLKASIKARQVFTWIFGKEDSKFKNCENLQVL